MHMSSIKKIIQWVLQKKLCNKKDDLMGKSHIIDNLSSLEKNYNYDEIKLNNIKQGLILLINYYYHVIFFAFKGSVILKALKNLKV